MFGISAEVGVLPVLEAGEEMGGFIEGLGLLPHGSDQKGGEDGEECGGDVVGGAMAGYCGLEGLRVGHDDVFLQGNSTERFGARRGPFETCALWETNLLVRRGDCKISGHGNALD